MANWSPESWQAKPNNNQPVEYPDQAHVAKIEAQLASMPPLVTEPEIEKLKQHIASAGRGEQFILQGGDCAESFADCQPRIIANKLKILLQMSLILLYGLRKPIIRVGRIAGQYAKPRSSGTETQDGTTLPSYRGDLINQSEFTLQARTPNPELMLQGYQQAGLTLNYIRSLASGGFADLHHPESWNLDFVEHSPYAKEYLNTAATISDALNFIQSIPGSEAIEFDRVDFFTSHEALHLPYETPFTRQNQKNRWYNLGTHLPWIGKRTANLDGPHVEYMRGIANPIGLKVGADMSTDWLCGLIETLNPDNEPGRLTLIHRFGAKQIADKLPALIKLIQKNNYQVTWMSDPMHGNTETTEHGIKTRRFDNILAELKQAFDVHQKHGSVLGGVHFELTGDNVTECTGGARGLSDADLKDAYKSLVDPRLNYEQALEMAMLIVRKET